mmetsp:Transcript_23337/g.34048  ORF Transcript_23337/g.34048 Transcript_23337/m.34048 type:complete len:241 (+) Transcript_23337:172-894(+)
MTLSPSLICAAILTPLRRDESEFLFFVTLTDISSVNLLVTLCWGLIVPMSIQFEVSAGGLVDVEHIPVLARFSSLCVCFCLVESSSFGRILQTHSGTSPEKWTTPLSVISLCSPFLSTSLSSHRPFPSGAVSISVSLAASASIKAAFSNLTLSSHNLSQKEVPSKSVGLKSRKLVTLCETKPSRPPESKTTIKSGILRKICSLRRRSSFSSLSSSMKCFFLLRESWAERLFAARFSSFLS